MNKEIKIGMREVEAYRQAKWSVARCIAMVFSLFGMLGCVALGKVLRQANHSGSMYCGVACFFLLLGFCLACNIEVSSARKCTKEISDFLDRWAKFSGRSLEDFPTVIWQCVSRGINPRDFPMSPQFLAGYAFWARTRLLYLAQILNAAYAYEETIIHVDPSRDFSCSQEFRVDTMQRDCRALDALIEQFKNDSAGFVDTRVAAKELYLGFWNLVTRGRSGEDGLEILMGSEYQNPEIFRKNLLPVSASAAVVVGTAPQLAPKRQSVNRLIKKM